MVSPYASQLFQPIGGVGATACEWAAITFVDRRVREAKIVE
jgi:hypothetical protein